jgi:hypothetical protein
MEHSERDCALCGKPIQVGEAWMRSEEEGSGKVAHSSCMYSEAMTPEERAWWVPADYGLDE